MRPNGLAGTLPDFGLLLAHIITHHKLDQWVDGSEQHNRSAGSSDHSCFLGRAAAIVPLALDVFGGWHRGETPPLPTPTHSPREGVRGKQEANGRRKSACSGRNDGLWWSREIADICGGAQRLEIAGGEKSRVRALEPNHPARSAAATVKRRKASRTPSCAKGDPRTRRGGWSRSDRIRLFGVRRYLWE
jgi:hypothetical protein